MTAEHTAAEDDGGAVPIACALTPAGLAARSGRWQRLAARAMIRRTETARGLHLCFRAEPGVEQELRRLAAMETECCPWADWTVHTNTGRVVLDVRSAGQGIAALHTMFTGLRPGPYVVEFGPRLSALLEPEDQQER
jgi:hypothetical protein